MKNIIVDCKNDSKELIEKKFLVFDVYNMLALKEKKLWWKEDEKKFQKKYKGSDKAQNIIDYFKRKGLK